MKRPLWFRRNGLHWTPCAWQGWLAIAVFSLTVAAMLSLAPAHLVIAVAAAVVAVALLIGIAAATDDTHEAPE